MNGLDYLSDHLKSMRRMFREFQPGGLVIGAEDLDAIVTRFDEFIVMARQLENEVSRREWNKRAEADRLALMTGPSVAVLAAMRNPNSNVVGFPMRPAGGGPSDKEPA